MYYIPDIINENKKQELELNLIWKKIKEMEIGLKIFNPFTERNKAIESRIKKFFSKECFNANIPDYIIYNYLYTTDYNITNVHEFILKLLEEKHSNLLYNSNNKYALEYFTTKSYLEDYRTLYWIEESLTIEDAENIRLYIKDNIRKFIKFNNYKENFTDEQLFHHGEWLFNIHIPNDAIINIESKKLHKVRKYFIENSNEFQDVMWEFIPF